MPGDNRDAIRLTYRMICKLRLLAGSVALLFLCASAGAQGTPLTEAEIAAADSTDDFSIPMPAELMAALDKQGKLDWSAKFRAPIPTDYQSRAQLALNLGTLVADGFIAVEAQDARQVKNIGKDILQIAKNLGVSKDVLMRGSSITDFAERKQWDQLKEELESTENEVKQSMNEGKDSDLITLVSAGAWVRGVEVISGHVAAKYSEASARILRQPAIVAYLRKKLDALPDKVRDEPRVKTTRVKLMEIETLVTCPREKAPSLESVKRLNELTSELVAAYAKKDQK
jgi:hypothetical protein